MAKLSVKTATQKHQVPARSMFACMVPTQGHRLEHQSLYTGFPPILTFMQNNLHRSTRLIITKVLRATACQESDFITRSPLAGT